MFPRILTTPISKKQLNRVKEFWDRELSKILMVDPQEAELISSLFGLL